MTARPGTRPTRAASIQRISNPESAVFIRSSNVLPKEMKIEDFKSMKIKGICAPSEETMDVMKRSQMSSAYLNHFCP